MRTNPNTRAPSHSIYVVQGDGETARWIRIGAAWPNQDGKGFSMKLDAAPIAGRVVMRANKPQIENRGALL